MKTEEILRDDETVRVTYMGTRTVRMHSSGRAKRNWPKDPKETEGVDEYCIEWKDHPDVPLPSGLSPEIVHYRVIGCPDCKINSRAVFRGGPQNAHYECLVCGYTNVFDPKCLPSMRRTEAEVID